MTSTEKIQESINTTEKDDLRLLFTDIQYALGCTWEQAYQIAYDIYGGTMLGMTIQFYNNNAKILKR